MSTAVPHHIEMLHAPLTAAAVRHMLGWSQVRVAAMAGVSTSTVRLYEIAPSSISPAKREALARVYESMRALVLPPPR